MHEVMLLRMRLAGWLLAATFAASALGAAVKPSPLAATNRPAQAAQAPSPKDRSDDGTNSASFEVLAAPDPTPADRRHLDAAFTKATPASVVELKAMQREVEALVAKVSPAVVAVEVGNGSGSAVIISPDGYVLTAGHVCGAANRDVVFTFPDGKTARGKTLGLSRTSDLGLMKINGDGPWPFDAMGDLSNVRAGDWVLALGHPGGFDLTRSLVVRLGRLIQIPPDSDVLRSDCPISPGDSGGPLFDMFGRVIGIHSYISTAMTANFHVPVTDLNDMWNRLLGVPRAYAGLRETDDHGCRIIAIDSNGPASKAGLQVGDTVLKVDGRDIRVAAFFRRWEAEAAPGDTLNLEIKRGEQVLSKKLVLASPLRRH